MKKITKFAEIAREVDALKSSGISGTTKKEMLKTAGLMVEMAKLEIEFLEWPEPRPNI